SLGGCELGGVLGDCCCDAPAELGELAGGISAVPGCALSRSGGVATRFDGAAAVAESADGATAVRGGEGAAASAIGAPAPDAAVGADAAAEAAAAFQVSEAAVSAPDCAAASALRNRTGSIAAIDAPKA